MNRSPILVLACLALFGCQTNTSMSDDPCPSPHPCDDPTTEAWRRLGPPPAAVVTQAVYRPLKPGCPSTLQVMARPRPVVYHAVSPEEAPDADPDPADLVCDDPDLPLQRADWRRPDRDLAAR